MPRTGRRSPPPRWQDSQHGGPIRQRSQAVRSYKLRSAGQGNRPGHVACRDGESSSSSVSLPDCGERSPRLQSREVHSDFIIADGIPVIREVRDIYGGSPSISYDRSYGDEIPEKDASILETVFGLFSEYSGVGLKRMLRNDPAVAEASEGETITKKAIIGRG